MFLVFVVLVGDLGTSKTTCISDLSLQKVQAEIRSEGLITSNYPKQHILYISMQHTSIGPCASASSILFWIGRPFSQTYRSGPRSGPYATRQDSQRSRTTSASTWGGFRGFGDGTPGHRRGNTPKITHPIGSERRVHVGWECES